MFSKCLVQNVPVHWDSARGGPGLSSRYSAKLSGNWQLSGAWGQGTLWPTLYQEL